MTVPRFFGRCVLIISLGALQTPLVLAQSAADLSTEISTLEGAVTQEWGRTFGLQDEKLDEQIFTEISPLLDAPDAVKLPDDQQDDD